MINLHPILSSIYIQIDLDIDGFRIVNTVDHLIDHALNYCAKVSLDLLSDIFFIDFEILINA